MAIIGFNFKNLSKYEVLKGLCHNASVYISGYYEAHSLIFCHIDTTKSGFIGKEGCELVLYMSENFEVEKIEMSNCSRYVVCLQ